MDFYSKCVKNPLKNSEQGSDIKNVLKLLKIASVRENKAYDSNYLHLKTSLEVYAFRYFLYDVLSIFRAHQYMYNMSFLLFWNQIFLFENNLSLIYTCLTCYIFIKIKIYIYNIFEIVSVLMQNPFINDLASSAVTQ